MEARCWLTAAWLPGGCGGSCAGHGQLQGTACASAPMTQYSWLPSLWLQLGLDLPCAPLVCLGLVLCSHLEQGLSIAGNAAALAGRIGDWARSGCTVSRTPAALLQLRWPEKAAPPAQGQRAGSLRKGALPLPLPAQGPLSRSSAWIHKGHRQEAMWMSTPPTCTPPHCPIVNY